MGYGGIDMKTCSEKKRFGVLALAVSGALAQMSAHAEDLDVKALTTPTNFVELGAANVSQTSAKFGEYNGLNKDAVYGIGNFSVQGGGAHDGSDGTRQWQVKGRDIGLTSREFGATIGDQGQWNLGIGYDELQHNLTNTYQTPQQGSMGGNNFTLPANFGAINSATGQPSARTLNANQLGAFHTEEVSTTRKNSSFNAGYIFNPQWSTKFEYNHLDQSGAKLIGTGAQGGINLTGGSSGRGEANNILMNPTNYTTDTYNLAFNWVGDKGSLTASYFASVFRDANNSLNWQNNLETGASACVGVNCFQNNSMSTAPSNTFQQLNLIGNYAFSSSTKLSGGLSYGRNTQDASYGPTTIGQPNGTTANSMQAGGLPQSSLDGSVVTTHADLKLTNQTTKDLVLSAGFKYNERDNQTSSNTYKYYNLGGLAAGQAYTAVNTPYSNRKTQYDLAADYRLAKGQNLRLAYEYDDIKRWCDHNAVAGAECVASPSSRENKLGLTYRLKAGDSVSLTTGYTYSKLDGDFNNTYLSPIGNSPQAGINGKDVPGFVAYPYASRTQDIFKAGVTWQATEQLDLGLTGRYSHDKYDATLGVQNGKTTSINLDATYTYSENGSVSAYASWQNSDRNMQNQGSNTATQNWTDKLSQDDQAFGLSAKQGGLMGGKLELMGDVSYSFGKSGYSTQVPYTSGATLCSLSTQLTCGSTPDVKSTLTSLKLTGTYSIDKKSKVALIYLYQKLNSNDYYYNGYQYGYTPNRVMPSNEQAPNYNVNVIAVTYTYIF